MRVHFTRTRVLLLLVPCAAGFPILQHFCYFLLVCSCLPGCALFTRCARSGLLPAPGHEPAARTASRADTVRSLGLYAYLLTTTPALLPPPAFAILFAGFLHLHACRAANYLAPRLAPAFPCATLQFLTLVVSLRSTPFHYTTTLLDLNCGFPACCFCLPGHCTATYHPAASLHCDIPAMLPLLLPTCLVCATALLAAVLAAPDNLTGLLFCRLRLLRMACVACHHDATPLTALPHCTTLGLVLGATARIYTHLHAIFCTFFSRACLRPALCLYARCCFTFCTAALAFYARMDTTFTTTILPRSFAVHTHSHYAPHTVPAHRA